jgi:sulfur transfer complex TusBCD TusB component (DsrH family)
MLAVPHAHQLKNLELPQNEKNKLLLLNNGVSVALKGAFNY